MTGKGVSLMEHSSNPVCAALMRTLHYTQSMLLRILEIKTINTTCLEKKANHFKHAPCLLVRYYLL